MCLLPKMYTQDSALCNEEKKYLGFYTMFLHCLILCIYAWKEAPIFFDKHFGLALAVPITYETGLSAFWHVFFYFET